MIFGFCTIASLCNPLCFKFFAFKNTDLRGDPQASPACWGGLDTERVAVLGGSFEKEELHRLEVWTHSLLSLLPRKSQGGSSAVKMSVQLTVDATSLTCSLSLWGATSSLWAGWHALPTHLGKCWLEKPTSGLTWPVWLSGLGIVLQSERLLVRFLVGAQAWVVGSAPGLGA